MKNVLEFCIIRKINLRRKGDNFPTNRKNDRNIMESFVNNGYHSHQLASINRCRIFLKVIHLSDITTGDGQYISRDAYNVKSEQWSTPRCESIILKSQEVSLIQSMTSYREINSYAIGISNGGSQLSKSTA